MTNRKPRAYQARSKGRPYRWACINIPKELEARISEIAEARNTSVAAICRGLLEQALAGMDKVEASQ